MRKAYVLNQYDFSDVEEVGVLANFLSISKDKDTEENCELAHRYVYNHIRELLGTDNVVQICKTVDDDKWVILEYDCKPNELKFGTIPKQDDNGIYLEIQ